MEVTRVAPLMPGCPECGAALRPATCTMGTVIRCPGCQAAVSLVIRPAGDKRALTFEVERPAGLPTRLPEALRERFDVVSQLGRGGQGEVLRVRPRGATRDYALKWTRAVAGDRSLREANYGVMPAHPNVLAPLQTGAHDGFQFMVFDLVEGEALSAVLEREGPLSAARAVAFAHHAASALAHVHQNGVIHRDVKPANFLVAQDGTLRLTDFGVATSVGAAPQPDEIIGTPPYMAPEQVSLAELTPALDVYALGCVLYEMLAGRPPFVRESLIELLTVRLEQDAPPVEVHAPDCPGPLANFVARLLARDPRARPADGAAALAELAQVQRACDFPEHLDLPALPRESARHGAVERSRMHRRMQLPVALLGGACVLATALVIGVGAGYEGALMAGAAALLWLSLGGLSRERLGDAQAWWRGYLDPGGYDPRDLHTVLGVGLSVFCVGLAIMVGVVNNSLVGAALALWFLTLVLGVRALLPSLIELAGPPPEIAQAPPELRVYVPQDGWHYRVLPAGQELPLPHRVELAEGLNRLELWRAGGRRRVFTVWATAGMQLAMRLSEAKDGPRVADQASPRLLPPGVRTSAR